MAGSYTLTMTLNDVAISGVPNPIQVECVPGNPDAQGSVAFGPGLERVTLDPEGNSFLVYLYDRYGNELLIGGKAKANVTRLSTGTTWSATEVENFAQKDLHVLLPSARIGHICDCPDCGGPSYRWCPLHCESRQEIDACDAIVRTKCARATLGLDVVHS